MGPTQRTTMEHQIDRGELVARVHAALKKRLPGFVVRSQQQAMMNRALGLFGRSQTGLIEAPTGTGKSLGYLLPGLASALVDDRLLVIATATASLQDQLAKDIPLLSDAFVACGMPPIRMAVAKGRERHVCPLRLQDATSVKDMFEGEDDAVLDMISDRFAGKRWNGLRDTLPVPVSVLQWKRINNTANTCAGKRCALYEECPYYLTQEAIRQAHVVITNHDYLLSCLAHIPSSPLAAEGTMYVFDEAHHLPPKMLSTFARRLDLGSFPDELLSSVLPLCAEHRRTIELSAASAKARWDESSAMLTAALGSKGMCRFPLGKPPEAIAEVLAELLKEVSGLKSGLDNAKDSFRTNRSMSSKPRAQNALLDIGDMKFGQLIGEIEAARSCLSDFSSDAEIARWVTRGLGPVLCCSPFDSAGIAKRHVWPVVKTAVLTSATLTTLGSFNATLRNLGLPQETSVLRLSSPFDYTQSRVVVPRLAPDGTAKAHARLVKAYVAEKGVRAAGHVGVLVYFTSRKLMNECYEYLPEHERSMVLLQGQWQPSAMIAEHRRRIDDGAKSIIFGLDTLGEGIDLPGRYCSLVLISRLPFPSPDDPVIATHAEFLSAKGLDPFRMLTLPKAGLKFAQVCGRLVRREGDGGDIVVLDQRIVTKRYGMSLLRGTEFTTIHST